MTSSLLQHKNFSYNVNDFSFDFPPSSPFIPHCVLLPICQMESENVEVEMIFLYMSVWIWRGYLYF